MNDEKVTEGKTCCNGSEEAGTSKGGSCCSTGGCSMGVSGQQWQSIFAQVKSILLDPINCWQSIKSENKSVKEIYLSYLIPLAVVGVVAQILGNMLFGGAFGFIHGIAFTVVIGIINLAMLYVGGFLFSTLAEFFGPKVSLDDGFRLVAYGTTASLVSGVLAIYPPLAGLNRLFLLYGFYTLYSGIPTMTGITEKRLPYFAAALASFLVAGFLIPIIVVGVLGLNLAIP